MCFGSVFRGEDIGNSQREAAIFDLTHKPIEEAGVSR
jgi:hypothetical protein